MIRAEDEVRDALSDELARLTGNNGFTVVEFGTSGATIWQFYRDENGTPQAERTRARPSILNDPDIFYRKVYPAFVVRTSGVLAENLYRLLKAPRGVPVYECQTSLEAEIREAIINSPLVRGYELAVLRQVPDGRPDAGRLVLTGHHLFPPGVTKGHRASVRVRCEATGGNGTIFAVVTRDHQPNIPPSSQVLRPVHIQSAVLPADTYEITAELARPGRVRLHGLPAELSKFSGSWETLRHQLPDQLTAATESVHLVCLVELSDDHRPDEPEPRPNRLALRIDRLTQLIEEAEGIVGRLNVSVVAYGPHVVAWRAADQPVSVPAWAASGARAKQELRKLASHRRGEREYLRAAQLECALETVARHLSDQDGRPVIVTAGRRPPHPPAMDTRTTLIPCPDRVNWKWQIDKIETLGATFGALRDADAHGEIWRSLGRDAKATVEDAVDMPEFAALLGLHEAAQTVPFPFVD
jgi:hypothetical protein